MLYRITIEKYLSHMIDYFRAEELAEMQYAIISAKVKNSGKSLNVVKATLEIYPPSELIIEYGKTQNLDVFRKGYMNFLKGKLQDTVSQYTTTTTTKVVYRTFVEPVLNHHDICIICAEDENYYMDVFCEFIKKYFALEVIDLNVLFTKGKIGPISIDRDKIKDKAVDTRRAAIKDMKRSYESTHDGRAYLISLMSEKEKIKKLKKFGVNVSKRDDLDTMHLDTMLLDVWDEEMKSKGL